MVVRRLSAVRDGQRIEQGVGNLELLFELLPGSVTDSLASPVLETI